MIVPHFPSWPGAAPYWAAAGILFLAVQHGARAADLPAQGAVPAAPAEVDFVRDIRPLLSDQCFHCHGPDEKSREADLRLDTQGGLTRVSGGKAVVVPGNPGESELWRRLVTKDPDARMPPPDSGKKLSADQIGRIEAWIAGGAPWSGHWAFSPLVKPRVPALVLPPGPGESAPALRNAIDAFVAWRHQREKLAFAPQAGKATLLRRVTLDLTGLPPAPDELASFLADNSPDAYERAVDRLLESPAFGERWAWDWLDAARYADSNGYQGDGERTMWPWRDWVIGALNRNLSYREFTIWQLAGDLLPEATFEQQLATGFCRNHTINGEGGRIAEENRVDYVMDMTETTGIVWLGLTLNCCRCHDHKYDPILQRDYYRLFAFFNQTPVDGSGGNPQTPPVLASPGYQQQLDIFRLEEELAQITEKRRARGEELAADEAAWEARQPPGSASPWVWKAVRPATAKAARQTLEIEEGGEVFASGENPANDTYTLEIPLEVGRVAAVRLDALRHASHTQGGLARSNSGNFVLTEIELALARVGSDQPRGLKIAAAEGTFEQGGFPVQGAFDGNAQTGWAVWNGKAIDRDHAAVFRLAEPLEAQAGDSLRVTLRFDSPHASHNLGRFRLAVAADAKAPLQNGPEQFLAAALARPREQRTLPERHLVTAAHREQDELYRQLAARRAQAAQQLNALREAAPKVMVMAERPEPRQSFMLERGLYNQPGDEVSPGVPGSLPPLPAGERANRLALARWLVADENPLTARVTVNRYWQQVFGVGLVKTTEDFGVQGEVPPHRELLDYLAAEFRDSGWNLKALLRLMVTSHTYRQSSQIAAGLAERDPENRLLARGPRFRLPFFMLRDQALAAGGLLMGQVGGPPVNGYQPPGVWEEATFGNKRYTQDKGAALYRRGLYTFWRRIIAPTIFFDSASRQVCTVKGLRTNTPLHALFTLNDITFVEAARALAQQALLAEATGEAERLDVAFRRLLARPATAAEQQVLLAALHRSRAEFARDRAAAEKLLAVGESPRAARLEAVEHASWTALCLTLLNLDEALTKE